MDDQRLCRLRVHGDDLDLTGPAQSLRALADALRGAADTLEIPIRNGAVVQRRAEGPLAIELRGSPTLHLSGAPDELAAVWSALDSVATATDAGTEDSPHRHVGRLVVTGERPSPDDL
ncbi:hypothetical protein [Dactylosporangium sp. CA-139066]|uniref:hypothetical protein n=1 Tax=Dactylosporangium sp. CA-139066 TaxID=3239930 RepID=UPI003D8B2818